MGWDLLGQTLLRAGTARQRELCLDPQCVQLAIDAHPSKCTLQMVETTENILAGHKAKTLRTENKKKGKPSPRVGLFWCLCAH